MLSLGRRSRCIASWGRGFWRRFIRKRWSGSLLVYREIAFESQRELVIHYRGQPLSKAYICDFLCFGKVLVELKAMDRLTGREEAQLINYLKSSGLSVGLLINFGSHGKLEWRRLVKSQ